MSKEVTINDVAKAAGVSKGTVDRVIHNRGEVSENSRKAVLAVIQELGYKPNLYASLLASGRRFKIVCLIPSWTEGDFWSMTAKGISAGARSVSQYGVDVEVVTFDQYDPESFESACSIVLDSSPSGVIFAPLFASSSLSFAGRLHSRGIPYIYIDTKLEDDDYLAYFGMPMYQSGYLCAHLLTECRHLEKVNVIRVERDKSGLSDPTRMRRMGFQDYMSEHCPAVVINNVFIDPRSSESISDRLDAIREWTGNEAVVMFNSRIHIVADYLRGSELRAGRVIGFDALERNVAALKDGSVDILIAQHSDRQACSAVNAMADYLVKGDFPERKDNYTQLDILNRYNCDYFSDN